MISGRIRIPNIIRDAILDKYEYQIYSEIQKLFEYYLWGIIRISGGNYSNIRGQLFEYLRPNNGGKVRKMVC